MNNELAEIILEDNEFISERFYKNMSWKNIEFITLMYRNIGRKYHSCNFTKIYVYVRYNA